MAEPFAEGQKGSSAMPHKRNPVRAERLCGLARVVRAAVAPGLEDVALWHERDISHSSVERTVLPDSLVLTGFCLREATWLAEGLVVDADRARAHLEVTSLGLVYSQSVLLALVAAGRTRDEAYRLVQRAAAQATAEQRPLREVLDGDGEVGLSTEALDEAFDLERLLRHRKRLLEAVASL